MGNVDGVPVASQVKSLVQAARGNTDDAWATQHRFSERCVGAAQLRSAVEAIRGDVDAAAETQRKFLENSRRLLGTSEVADAVPVVSQLKSVSLLLSGSEADAHAAAETQRNFLRRCPFVSQAYSAFDLVVKGPEEAMESQREFIRFASNSADRVPGLGHLKALAHRGLGHEERAVAAFTAAERSRTRGVELLGGAARDIFGLDNEVTPPPEAVCNTCGPLDEVAIRHNTLLFAISEEQLRSHTACPICLVDFCLGEEALTLRCFHVFHPLCGERWLRENGNCPVCRVGAAPAHT